MDVFAFREELIAEYAQFSRSFTRIRADDISRELERGVIPDLFADVRE